MARVSAASPALLIRSRANLPANLTSGQCGFVFSAVMKMPETIATYRILHKLGEGGMGVVYAAHDEKLDRPVALKMLSEASGPEARERLWREARAAARVNHPNICQIYDVGEYEGEIYLAMELLEGEPLSARIHRGALALGQALPIVEGILNALSALHEQGVVHRDLKPSNVFMTRHGVKILDFGLAVSSGGTGLDSDGRLTQTGMLLGTPRYMSPEQWEGREVGPATDLFACGALLFEMIAGRPAFEGSNSAAMYHAITREQPPVLTGGPLVIAVDRVIHQALEKRPQDRFASAEEMGAALIDPGRRLDDEHTMPLEVRAITRLIVLPFRMLRPDPEIDFLAFSLADAITVSLSGLESLVVRSSRAAGALAEGDPDLSRLAGEIEVDAVLFGTLLRSGDQVRLSTQLVEAPGGTLLCSNNAQVSIGDVFQLQDELTARVVESLAIPLSAREERLLHHDAPRSSRAYELYLRANNAVSPMMASNLKIAGDLYRESLLDDSQFAPAWARLGRVCRILAKYGHGDAEQLRAEAQKAFSKALELNPDLPLAHNYYTYFEVEELGDPVRAMRRLLAQAQTGSADPDLFVGLVVACRFCGLLEASLAAADRAHRLDPGASTSTQYTYWQLGDYERALEVDRGEARFVSTHVYATRDEIERLREVSRNIESPDLGGKISRLPLAAAQGDREGCLRAYRIVRESAFSDREGFYFMARCLARVGEDDEALNLLGWVVDGFVCDRGLEEDPWFADLRSDERFQALTDRAADQHKVNAEIFETVGGPEILGI